MVASENLLIRPSAAPNTYGETISFTPDEVGWEHLGFRAVRLQQGGTISSTTAETEVAIVVLGGQCSVTSSAGKWDHVGRRKNVFNGLAYTVYLPVHTDYAVTAQTDLDIAICSCPAQRSFPARLITPRDVKVDTRGGGNATRQICNIITPDDSADRLIIIEVYTPAGNWSSFPPHKHDVHNPPSEVDLEEIYYYRIERPEGYAIQRVYSYDGTRDATLTVRDGELVLIPDGYHPVVAAHGYNVYYLNALSGSARSLAASLDPNYAWVSNTWDQKDPRVPFVKEPPSN
ncbi:MAG TPA: 5-deoxy-glucuronate isomerase [Bryobacteraceae bacterium]|nr:5-deoxy-glucuronate isomerase [Bryobacteraceae bacterium]